MKVIIKFFEEYGYDDNHTYSIETNNKKEFYEEIQNFAEIDDNGLFIITIQTSFCTIDAEKMDDDNWKILGTNIDEISSTDDLPGTLYNLLSLKRRFRRGLLTFAKKHKMNKTLKSISKKSTKNRVRGPVLASKIVPNLHWKSRKSQKL